MAGGDGRCGRGPLHVVLPRAGANPVVGSPTFRFALPAAANVTIALFDVSGRRIAKLADGSYSRRAHIQLERGPRQPGVYFTRMSANGRSLATRMVLMSR